MRRCLTILIILFFSLCSCTYSKFVLTGSNYEPLPEDKEVKVIPWGNQADYEVIGVAEIGESDIETRVEEAKKIARMNGGDIIAPKGIEVGDTEEPDVGYRLQNFLILKTKEGQEVAEVEEPQETPPEEVVPQVEDYPRASMRDLRRNYASLRGQKFQGYLYAFRFIKMPRRLAREVDKDKKVLGLRTSKRGKIKVFLLVPREEVDAFNDIISSKEKFKFVYTPVTVYKKRYPVLEYISMLE